MIGMIDRTGWPPGPWDGEPDRAEWRHAGLPCLAVRSRMGNWCGYVGVPPGHPAHGKDFEDVEVNAHGGLTYAAPCDEPVCHVSAPGEPDDVWWLGFDCAHAGDLVPTILSLPHLLVAEYGLQGRYWTLEMVRLATDDIAAELAAMGRP